MRVSSAGLLMLSLFVVGSSGSRSIVDSATAGPLLRNHAVLEHNRLVRVRHLTRAIGAPALVARVIRDRSASAADTWFIVMLAGGTIALQLRRTQKSARMTRLTT
jgi:hypothetical protein